MNVHLPKSFAKDRLRALKADFATLAPKLVEKAPLATQLSSLASAGVRQLTEAQLVPAFELEDVTGGIVSLADRLALGPVVMAFLHGDWWPYSHDLGQSLLAALPLIEVMGATMIIAATRRPLDKTPLRILEALPVSVVIDQGSRVKHAFRQAHRVKRPAKSLQFSGPIPGFACVLGQDRQVLLGLDESEQSASQIAACALETIKAYRSSPIPSGTQPLVRH